MIFFFFRGVSRGDRSFGIVSKIAHMYQKYEQAELFWRLELNLGPVSHSVRQALYSLKDPSPKQLSSDLQGILFLYVYQ